MEVNSQSDLLIADLRKAAIPGAFGSAADGNVDILVDPATLTGAGRFIPNPAPLAVAIDGPGLFVFEDGSRRVYGRLGDFRLDSGRLVDGSGRVVLGFRVKNGTFSNELQPIVVTAGLPANATYQIDENGVLSAGVRSPQTRFRKPRNTVTPIARIALALFPVPQRLEIERGNPATLLAVPAAGSPSLRRPGEGGAGSLRTHVVAAGSVDIQADLYKLWLLRRKAELDAAMAAASDECTRTALGLVR